VASSGLAFNPLCLPAELGGKTFACLKVLGGVQFFSYSQPQDKPSKYSLISLEKWRGSEKESHQVMILEARAAGS